jgi:hypothetical protein
MEQKSAAKGGLSNSLRQGRKNMYNFRAVRIAPIVGAFAGAIRSAVPNPVEPPRAGLALPTGNVVRRMALIK